MSVLVLVLVVGFVVCVFILGGSLGFSWVMGYRAFALGNMSDGARRFPLLYTFTCASIDQCHDIQLSYTLL